MAMMVDILSLGLGLVSAGVFSVILRNAVKFGTTPGTVEAMAEGTNGLIKGGAALIHKRLDDELKLDQEAALGVSLSLAISAFYESYSDLPKKLFDGSEESITILRNLFVDGSLTGTAYEPVGDVEIRKVLEKSLYAIIIPQSWMLSEEKTNMAVIKTDITCEKNGSDLDYYRCINGFRYRIVAAIGKAMTCLCTGATEDNNCNEVCKASVLSDPPGIGTMDGTRWGGLTPKDLIVGAYATFEANGKKNVCNSKQGGGLANVADSGVDLSTFGVGSAGMINIPVCTEAQLRAAWKDGAGDKYPNFPCP